jgi:2-amino-4-hydroxy-6-hydroxymethyldihydropteridine diphosphokinase
MRGGTARNPFLNGVVLLCTSLRPEELLELCQAEERRAGRRRATFWGDRTLDLDLLVVDGLVRESPALTLPHPGVSTRDFVRRPLLEVWPDVVHAAEGVPLADLPSARLPVAWAVGQLARGVYQRVENNPC